ncbi:sigma factor-like helix-turn-helix DNA-binding protein [Streptomyces sp. Tu10]|uniref:sigma factor-like helix-turn-helix DNA-binding protein n=1 Tax=Streptomyces sp. Tu10 TaxID=2838018 RepID=UPI0035A81C64
MTRRVAGSVGNHGADRLHRVLSTRQADVVLLRYRLGLTVRETSDLMGIATADVLVACRAALRSTAGHTATH